MKQYIQRLWSSNANESIGRGPFYPSGRRKCALYAGTFPSNLNTCSAATARLKYLLQVLT